MSTGQRPVRLRSPRRWRRRWGCRPVAAKRHHRRPAVLTACSDCHTDSVAGEMNPFFRSTHIGINGAHGAIGSASVSKSQPLVTFGPLGKSEILRSSSSKFVLEAERLALRSEHIRTRWCSCSWITARESRWQTNVVRQRRQSPTPFARKRDYQQPDQHGRSAAETGGS